LTSEIVIILGIVAVTLLLLISERIRIDLIALMVLVILAVTGLLTPTDEVVLLALSEGWYSDLRVMERLV
jgi:hypothetical protein